jgi:uncharacterized protein YcgI (DUF1989 family)
MEPPKGRTVERIEEIEIGDLSSDAQRDAAGRIPRAGRAFRIVIVAADGGSEMAEFLHFEATNRAGIGRSVRDRWLDAASVDEALRRWLPGERKLGSARPPERGDT